MPPKAPARPTSGNGTISRLREAAYNLTENEADSQYESWKVEETSTGTLVRIRGKAYTLSNTFQEVVEAIEAIKAMYSDLPAEFDAMVEAYLLELCQNEAIRAKEHDEQGGTYTFIVERDAEIERNNATGVGSGSGSKRGRSTHLDAIQHTKRKKLRA